MSASAADMKLPRGKTCGHCVHLAHRCSWLVGAKSSWTQCDFYPVRFLEKPVEVVDGDKKD
jgi:hypothetical protein